MTQHIRRKLVVGGTAVPNPNTYPFFVALYIGSTRNYAVCGASLIAPTWALTAAHCVHTYDAPSLQVGVYKRDGRKNQIYDQNCTQIIQVHSVHMDHMYAYVEGGHDVALLELAEQPRCYVAETGTGGPSAIRLDDGTYWTDGATSTLVGSGLTSQGGSNSLVQHEVDLTLYNRTFCKSIYGLGNTGSLVTQGQGAPGWSSFGVRDFESWV